MKRFILVFFGICTAWLWGQSPLKFELGLRGGLTWTDLSMKPFRSHWPMPDTEFRSGPWNAGGQLVAHARLQLLSFFVQPELAFTRNEGSIWAFPHAMQPYSVHDYTFTRLDGHLSMGMRFFSVLRLQGGPSMSYLLHVRDGSSNATPHFAATSFGWHVGLGMDISKVRIDFRYEPGLNHREGDWQGQSYRHSTRQLIIGLGLRF